MADKNCFFDKTRPCDLTCKAAFEVDDPVDNVDCYFVWLAHHLGEGLFDLKGFVEGFTGIPGFPGAGPPDEGDAPAGPPPGGPGKKGGGPKGFPKPPKGLSNN